MTVEEAVRTGATGTIGLFLERMTQGDFERARELIAAFGLARLAQRRLRDCSQGERARALVARALLARPRLLLLDEPAAGVDLPGREALLTALDRMSGELPDLALVMTTHHLEELPSRDDARAPSPGRAGRRRRPRGGDADGRAAVGVLRPSARRRPQRRALARPARLRARGPDWRFVGEVSWASALQRA